MPDLAEKFRFQLAGLGAGFLPEPWARAAISRGLLVEKTVDEERAAEHFYLAWRTGERGAALDWWLQRLRRTDLMARFAGSAAALLPPLQDA